MSIVPLLHATLVTDAGGGEGLLAGLQELGLLHVTGFDGVAAVEIDARVRATMSYLASSPRQHHRVRRDPAFDAEALVTEVEALRARAQALDEELLALRQRIGDVQPWGNFVLPELGDHPELRFWFYRVPPAQLGKLAATGHVWAQVNRTPGEAFIVVLSAQEPEDIPFARVHFGSRSLAQLEARLAQLEVEIDDVAAERASLTRWSDLFAAHVDRLLDTMARDHAGGALRDRAEIVLLRGWVPQADGERLARWAEANGHALHLRVARSDETPPTLLENAPMVAAGESLVTFFTMPAYRAWDPSWLVMGAFVVFFAMILGDAVYGTILLTGTALGWRAMGRKPGWHRLRLLVLLLALATTAWGVALGSYAGTPPPTRWLAALQLAAVSDYDLLIRIALGIGLAHLALANLLAGMHLLPSLRALARFGWVDIFAAVALWQFSPTGAQVLAGAGLLLVVLFTGSSSHLGPRLGQGLMALPRIVSVLGDTLSYLRLFALGIATASLAAAFNQLAASVASVPGAGVALGMLILLAGHTLNLLLGIAGGVIHGLRLNYIEFFGWALLDEGRPFLHFRKREQRT